MTWFIKALNIGPSAINKGNRILSRGRSSGIYQVRLAGNPKDLQAAQILRFQVFNLELDEGLEESYLTLLDADRFDPVCDHLLIEDVRTNEVIGTYRLQTGMNAAAHLGYYSEQEFNFSPYESIRDQLIELGRACVHKSHRNLTVLGLLWNGIAQYAHERGLRYLIGCSSLTSQNPEEGASMYAALSREHLAPARWRTTPKTEWECPLDRKADRVPKIPKLLAAYLAIGAKICGPPALDRKFKTIDFLTFVDLEALSLSFSQPNSVPV